MDCYCAENSDTAVAGIVSTKGEGDERRMGLGSVFPWQGQGSLPSGASLGDLKAESQGSRTVDMKGLVVEEMVRQAINGNQPHNAFAGTQGSTTPGRLVRSEPQKAGGIMGGCFHVSIRISCMR